MTFYVSVNSDIAQSFLPILATLLFLFYLFKET